MRYGRTILSVASLLVGAGGMFFAGRGNLLNRIPGLNDGAETRPAPVEDSAFEVVCKWHAALAAGDGTEAAKFVSGAEAESDALAREMQKLRGSKREADREKLEAFRSAAFSPGGNEDDRTELTLIAGAERRIGIVLKKSGGKWKIVRISDRDAPHVDTPVEVARRWHNALLAGDAETAAANSYGDAQKSENHKTIRVIEQLSRSVDRDPGSRKVLESLRDARFSDTVLRASVLVSTGGHTQKILLENINGKWKVVGSE